eukprot:1153639-Pelagomonas_calceolata.AAC.8
MTILNTWVVSSSHRCAETIARMGFGSVQWYACIIIVKAETKKSSTDILYDDGPPYRRAKDVKIMTSSVPKRCILHW